MPSWYICGNERYRGPVLSGTPAGVAFDTGSALGGVALTNSNLTATSTSASLGFARSTTSHSSGKYYLEMTCTNDPGSATFGVGVVDTTYTAGVSFIGSDTHSTAYYNTNGRFFNNADQTAMSGVTYTTSDVVRVCIDLDNRKIWWTKNGAATFSPSNLTGDPAANTGGGDLSTFATNVYVAVDFEGSNTAAFTVNFGPTFTFTAPSGFGAW